MNESTKILFTSNGVSESQEQDVSNLSSCTAEHQILVGVGNVSPLLFGARADLYS